MSTTNLTRDKFHIHADLGAVIGEGNPLFAVARLPSAQDAKNKRFTLNGLKVCSVFDKHAWPSMADMIWAGRLHMTYATRPH